jgi:hypothetical protein
MQKSLAVRKMVTHQYALDIHLTMHSLQGIFSNEEADFIQLVSLLLSVCAAFRVGGPPNSRK